MCSAVGASSTAASSAGASAVGASFTAASSAKSTYDGYKYLEEKVNEKKKKKSVLARQGWFQIHDEGIWYGSYIMLERRNYRIYGNPRDKEKYETTKPTIR